MFLPPLSFKNSLRVTSFQISLNSLGFYLSRMLVEFFLTCIFQHVWKKVSIYVFLFLENALNLCIFTHAPVPHSKFQLEFFENLFPSTRKGWRKLWFARSKFNQNIWRWPGTLFYLHFVWFLIILNMMALEFCK